MQTEAIQSRISWAISWGALIVTLLVTDRISSEPVNVGKMVALTTIAFLLLGLGFKRIVPTIIQNRNLATALIIFLIFIALSVVQSENALERGIYGTSGRNTGFLTYLSLSIIFFSIIQIREKKFLSRPIVFFYVSAAINIIYCLFASAGLDIFRWTNPYNLVLGTFGNPNFIGAFMGITISLFLVALSSQEISKSLKTTILFFFLPASYVLYKSDALQGSLLVFIGVLILCYFLILERHSSAWWRISLTSFTVLIGIVGTLGIFGFGPLASLLNKPSIQFRGEYWFAGIQMGISNLLTGVGIDSYGTYYRTFRGSGSIISPGVDVTTDAAHNVYIDIFAGTGIIGFSAYLIFNLLLLQISLRHLRRNTNFSFQFKFFFTGWCLYQIQSLVSINQIGLAIWGWIFSGGLMVSIKLASSNSEEVKSKEKAKGFSKISHELIPPQVLLRTIVFSLVGLAISTPPFIRDMEMRKATATKSIAEVLETSLKWPTDSTRMNRSIIALANNSNFEEANKLVSLVNEKYPNDYLGWYTSLKIMNAKGVNTLMQKAKLHEIDPLNPEWK